jgi:uncharacterized membrane protein YkvA (DUF1232 family)
VERLRAVGKRVVAEISLYRRVLVHPNTPWLSRILLGAAIAYFVSPIDLLPDVIPVIGQLDDLIIVPGLVWLAFRFIPAEVIADCRKSIDSSSQRG